MDHPPRNLTPRSLRSSPFQARAFHFFKKLALRARGSGVKSRDTISPVAIPSQHFQRAHSSVDLLRKPDISPLIGYRVEDGPNPMDTDDSSQDASASSNSPRLLPRRYSTLDSLRTAPAHSTFTGHGAAPLFFRDQAVQGNDFQVDDSGNLLAPAPVFLRSNVSHDAIPQPPRSSASSPEIPPQIGVSPESKPDEEAVQNTLNDDTPRRLGVARAHNATLTTPLTDLTPSTSCYPGTLLRAQSLPAPEDSTLNTVQKRPTLLPRHSTSLPPPFLVTTERGHRLSPSVVTRQPMPLLNLPALPPPPPAPATPPEQKVPLRSIPSLSRHGHSNVGCHADHGNATLGDSDEDEGDEEEQPTDTLSVHQSDDDDDEPSSAGPSKIRGLKNSQKQRMKDGESLVEGPISPSSPQSDLVGPNIADYFCSKTYVKSIHFTSSSTSLAMYPFSPSIPSAEEANQRHAPDSDLSMPRVQLQNKPSLYRVASRSMIDLGSTRRAEQELRRLKSRETVQSNPPSASGHSTESRTESGEGVTEAVIGRLLRRTSMPNFVPTSDPPPYPTFNPRPKSSRVEDEEREPLPPYNNSLYLIAIMPRKVEFSSPGIQAKDRKWRRVVCELEGTTFRVYKCPPGASGAGVLGDWWEKRMGVGDVASPNPPRTRKKEEQFEIPAKLGIDDPQIPVTPPASSGQSMSASHTRWGSGSQSSVVTQSTMLSTPRPAKRISGASFLSPFRSSSSTRPESSVAETSRRPDSRALELLPVDMQDSRSSLSNESTPVAQRLSQPPQPRSASRLTFLSAATGRAQWRNSEIPKPPKSALLRAYTLQHAESGLGNDYLKRKNVIRVRLEGEQFLLQAPDIPAVVEWIEGLHAGTNIALDIDQRTMPRGPMFPRRRRRRTRRMQVEDTSGERASGPPVPA